MTWRKPIEVGDRYREAGTTAFGMPKRRVWVVEDVHEGIDGLVHVRLVDEADRRCSKTISTAALVDRRFYVPAGHRQETETQP